jgi:hypothetical protein
MRASGPGAVERQEFSVVERIVAAKLAEAVLAKVQIRPKKDAVKVAAYIHRRMLRAVRKADIAEGYAPPARQSVVPAPDVIATPPVQETAPQVAQDSPSVAPVARRTSRRRGGVLPQSP